MFSTNTINQQLLENAENTKKSETTLPLLLQFVFNLLTTFGRTGLPMAMLITDTFQYAQIIPKLSWQGIAGATPLAIFFSICESKVHDVESKHFERAKIKEKKAAIAVAEVEEKEPEVQIAIEEPIDTRIEVASPPAQNPSEPEPTRSCYQTFWSRPISCLPSFKKLNWQQTVLSCGHYLSDVSAGIEFPLLVAKLAGGIDDMDPYYSGLIYLGMVMVSCAGNWQELLNAITAFQEENEEEQAASPSSSPRRS